MSVVRAITKKLTCEIRPMNRVASRTRFMKEFLCHLLKIPHAYPSGRVPQRFGGGGQDLLVLDRIPTVGRLPTVTEVASLDERKTGVVDT